jgi:hypothetical protein
MSQVHLSIYTASKTHKEKQMTDTPKAVEVNCETGEVIERLLTAEEIASNAKTAAEVAAKAHEAQAEEQAKADAKTSALAKLTALGLTEEEAKAIAG